MAQLPLWSGYVVRTEKEKDGGWVGGGDWSRRNA